MISTSNFSSTLPVWLQNLSLPPSLPLRVRVRVTEEGAPRARDNVLEEAPLILLSTRWILDSSALSRKTSWAGPEKGDASRGRRAGPRLRDKHSGPDTLPRGV